MVGDGGIYFYLQDLIVLPPAHQGSGLGRLIMDTLLDFISSRAGQGSFIGLMAAQGAAGFYHKLGFQERPAGAPGMFRTIGTAEIDQEGGS